MYTSGHFLFFAEILLLKIYISKPWAEGRNTLNRVYELYRVYTEGLQGAEGRNTLTKVSVILQTSRITTKINK